SHSSPHTSPIHSPSHIHSPALLSLFFFNHPATTELYTLSLHDALPIFSEPPYIGGIIPETHSLPQSADRLGRDDRGDTSAKPIRSEEHTSELQSLTNLVCRLLLEKKKKIKSLDNRTVNQNLEHRQRQNPSTHMIAKRQDKTRATLTLPQPCTSPDVDVPHQHTRAT